VEEVESPPTSKVQAPLIWTKLQAPVARRGVERPRLTAALQAGLSRKVTLISAPAGWGKSTLLADWYNADRQQAGAWFASDDDDNDPVRFWTYLIESLHAVNETIGESSSLLLRTPGVSALEAIPYLINELDKASVPVVLVLEDYHLVRTPDIHDALTLLVERLPHQVRIVISSRSEPPLPLARWRAKGDLAEIDAERLRFSDGEAGVLLNEVHHLGLAAEDPVGSLRSSPAKTASSSTT
jgi:LuxR family maltose regulon positive regulatory protein